LPSAGAVGEPDTLAPDAVDHRMVGGGARIRARDAWIIEQRLRHLEQQRAG
jgi:hypothetical protein